MPPPSSMPTGSTSPVRTARRGSVPPAASAPAATATSAPSRRWAATCLSTQTAAGSYPIASIECAQRRGGRKDAPRAAAPFSAGAHCKE
ncbi:hypothetical protein WR25_05510 [Diploscapter pachys]|uniref:Uncharacterized protein n=1 Tax=Diploscapter pachys TaxID=2018661 RepID=A0A2A2M5M8_9BILA|nr:hypothetical protein WR25_05510 [Diploscapter pachys]